MTSNTLDPQPSLIALLPCPFCGHDAPSIYRQYDYETDGMFINVRCKCGVESAQQYASKGNDCPQTYQEVRDRWNTRPQSRPEAELPELPEPVAYELRYLPPNGPWSRWMFAHPEAFANKWPYENALKTEYRAVYSEEGLRAYGQQCAAPRPAEVGGDGWLPIESAPKNKRVLVWDGYHVIISMFGKVSHVPIYGWLNLYADVENIEIMERQPTHWKELTPPAPGSEVRP